MSAAWRDWNSKQWNDALVASVFALQGHAALPISRMDATSRFFAHVVGLPSSDGEEAKAAFLASFAPFRRSISRLFDLARLGDWTPESSDLPFFAQLYVTVLVASGDEDTHDIGNFRARLAVLLEVDSENLPLDGLAAMWRLAERWSEQGARRNTRRLKLPPPEHETRIGYSKRLAFPRFRDQRALERLLRSGGFDAASPVRSVVRAVDRSRRLFTDSFLFEFDLFSRLVGEADHKAALATPFWGAVADITWRKIEDNKAPAIDDLALELDVDDPYDPLFCLVSRKSVSGMDTFWKIRLRDAPDPKYRYELKPRGELRTTLFRALQLPEAKPLLARSGVSRGIEAECMAFCEQESGAWRSTGRLSPDEEFWLVAKGRKWRRVESRLADRMIRPLYTTPISEAVDWTLVGPLRMSEPLRSIAEPEFPGSELFALRLQPPSIRLTSGIRLPEGYLFLPTVLPSAVIRYAQGVQWRVLSGDVSEPTEHERCTSFRLEKSSAEGTFTFDECAPERIGGRPSTLELVALDEREIPLATTTCRVVPGCQSWELKQPSDLSDSWVVGDEGQLVPAAGEPEGGDVVQSLDVHDESLSFCPIGVAASIRFVEPCHIDAEVLPGQWNDAIEIITAKFVRAAVIPSGDLFDLLQRVFRVETGRVWDLMSDLIENGFIKQLYRRRWHGRVFCGSPPLFVGYDSGNGWVGRVVGLVPGLLRRNLAKLARAYGGRLVAIVSPGAETVGALEFSVANRADLEEIARAVEVPLACEPPALGLVPLWRKILMTEGYKCSGERTVWVDVRKQFVPVQDEYDTCPRLERFRITGRQDTYKLLLEKGAWNTRSREWALLGRAAAAGRFGTIDGAGSVSLSSGELTLPPVVSRGVVKWGGGVCFRDHGRCRLYPASALWTPESVLEGWVTPDAGDILTERLRLALSAHVGPLAATVVSRSRD